MNSTCPIIERSNWHAEGLAGPGEGAPPPDDTVATRIWIDEFDGLERMYSDAANCSPKLRYPDLISACVSLVFAETAPARQIFCFLHGTLVLRDQDTPRRQEAMWRAQYELLLSLQRSAMNRHPHPQFKLDHFTTACVALALAQPEAMERIFEQARRNIAQRALLHA